MNLKKKCIVVDNPDLLIPFMPLLPRFTTNKVQPYQPSRLIAGVDIDLTTVRNQNASVATWST